MMVSKELDTSRQFDDAEAIYVTQDGPRDAPALVLIHGLAASTRWWDDLVPLLARSHHVIRIDMLGHGMSAKPAGGGYGIPQHGQGSAWCWTVSA
jgi:pimeloyl-ACP methyl ester carboxylesterase